MFEITGNISLKNYNSFGIDVKSRFFTECLWVNEIVDFIKIHKKQD